MAPAAVLCVNCGYDRRTGRRLVTRRGAIELRASTLTVRMLRFGVVAVLGGFLVLDGFVLLVICACVAITDPKYAGGMLCGCLCSLFVIGFGCLVVGTFTVYRFRQETDGRVLMTRTRFVAFLPWPAIKEFDITRYRTIRCTTITSSFTTRGMVVTTGILLALGRIPLPGFFRDREAYAVDLTGKALPPIRLFNAGSESAMIRVGQDFRAALGLPLKHKSEQRSIG
jgi:hypothetical protein